MARANLFLDHRQVAGCIVFFRIAFFSFSEQCGREDIVYPQFSCFLFFSKETSCTVVITHCIRYASMSQ
ncbi:MAG: hypothetical protein CSA33_02630 [Desulfobulbus propionicus]|nr:MAG: hypothetical protein CSA33_02630 [Desulfobulbus propionicus]